MYLIFGGIFFFVSLPYRDIGDGIVRDCDYSNYQSIEAEGRPMHITFLGRGTGHKCEVIQSAIGYSGQKTGQSDAASSMQGGKHTAASAGINCSDGERERVCV